MSEIVIKTCSHENCERPLHAKGLCNKHYTLQRRYNRLENIRRKKGTFTISGNGYEKITKNGSQVYSHISKAEAALGKRIPNGAVVSFVGGKVGDSKNQSLVICEDKAYSITLKTREEALKATGNPRMRRCNRCKEWDLPKNMYCYQSDAKTGYRFKHQVNLGFCYSAPIPADKVKIKTNGRRRHFHYLDYQEVLSGGK